MLQLNNIIKYNNFNFEIKSNLIIFDELYIYGKNGSGKTTLLSFIINNIFYTKYKYYIILKNKICKFIHYNFFINIKKKLIFELLYIIYTYKYINLYFKYYKKIITYLYKFGLEIFIYSIISSLSTGQKKIILFIILNILYTKIWIIDELYMFIDKININYINLNCLEYLNNNGTILYANNIKNILFFKTTFKKQYIYLSKK